MPLATFGDLLGLAEGYLEAAITGADWPGADQAAAVAGLRAVVTSLGRYLDDLAAGDVIEAVGHTGLQPWSRAATDTRAALHQAGTCLDQAQATTGMLGSGPPDGTTRVLAAAAVSLTAGRDLLNTHRATTPGGLRTWRSEWAAVLASPAITRALTGQVSQWARRLVPLTMGLASASPSATAAVHDVLQSAAQWLGVVSVAVHPAQAADPVTSGDLRLLCAIPAAQAPPRRPPHDDETMADLCAGITVSAQRLRAATFVAPDHARESAAVGADAWRWGARAAAVTGHASEHMLHALASHPGPASRLLEAAQLHVVAESVAGAWRSWRRVSLAWNDLTTEPSRCPPSASIEIGDLLLRIGRLAHADPRWTPARSRNSHPGDPAALVTSAPEVIAAVHQAMDALAQLATADLHAVGGAARGRRLYVPTRTLPARYDVPRPYAPAPPDRPKPLLAAYRTARDASRHAADDLATLALAIDAPSSTLTLARAAVQPQPGRCPADQPRQPATGVIPTGQPDAGGVTPGPVEHAVRSLKVTDPIVLLRAASIDTAARTLISQAQRMSGSPGPEDASKAGSQQYPARAAVQLAALDTPPPRPGRQASGEKAIRTVTANLGQPATRQAHRAARAPHQGPTRASGHGHTR